jgi:hypothetical protein
MGGKRLAMAAAFCAFAIQGALAQKATPADPGRTPAGAPAAQAAKPAQWPVLLPDKSPPAAVAPWSPQEIELAQARCAALLKGLDVVAVPEVPLREGPECGTPAPMKLVSLGKNPQVALVPPPIVTCDMIAALDKWMQRDVQPLARKLLGAPVIRIDTMSSYSCRNAYGRSHSRLSEHGRANALDISAFITAKSQAAMVIADWGPTAREIAARAAADQGEAAKTQAAPPPAPVANEGVRVFGPGLAIKVPGVTVHMPGASETLPGLGLAPNRLGGPKPPQAAALPADPGAKMDFLRAAHDRACKLFHTVLGPEANTAHRNHFHVDMAERIKNTKVCE